MGDQWLLNEMFEWAISIRLVWEGLVKTSHYTYRILFIISIKDNTLYLTNKSEKPRNKTNINKIFLNLISFCHTQKINHNSHCPSVLVQNTSAHMAYIDTLVVIESSLFQDAVLRTMQRERATNYITHINCKYVCHV